MKLFSPFLVATTVLITAASVSAQNVTPIQVALVKGGNPQGYLSGANEQGILMARTASGKPDLIPFSNIRGEGVDKLINFVERGKALNVGNTHFGSENYDAAAAAFQGVVQKYSYLVDVPSNFASEAMFFLMESLKRNGDYEQLFKLYNTPLGQSVGKVLGARYQEPFKSQGRFAMLGGKQFDALEAELKTLEQPLTNENKLLGYPTFPAKLGPRTLSELSFLRAHVALNKKEDRQGLEDLYRSLSYNFSNQSTMARQAMEKITQLHLSDPGFKADGIKGRSLQALVFQKGTRYGEDSLADGAKPFFSRPAITVTAPQGADRPEKKAGGEDSLSGGE